MCVCVCMHVLVCVVCGSVECFLISTWQGKHVDIFYSLFFHNLPSQYSVLLPLPYTLLCLHGVSLLGYQNSFLTTLSAFRIYFSVSKHLYKKKKKHLTLLKSFLFSNDHSIKFKVHYRIETLFSRLFCVSQPRL